MARTAARLAAIAFSAIVTVGASASQKPLKNGFLVEAHATYVAPDGRQVDFEHTQIVADQMTGWLPFAPPRDGVALLGRLKPESQNVLRFEFMIVDTKRDNTVASSAQIVALPGEFAEVTTRMLETQEKTRIRVKAAPTVYREANQ